MYGKYQQIFRINKNHCTITVAELLPVSKLRCNARVDIVNTRIKLHKKAYQRSILQQTVTRQLLITNCDYTPIHQSWSVPQKSRKYFGPERACFPLLHSQAIATKTHNKEAYIQGRTKPEGHCHRGQHAGFTNLSPCICGCALSLSGLCVNNQCHRPLGVFSARSEINNSYLVCKTTVEQSYAI